MGRIKWAPQKHDETGPIYILVQYLVFNESVAESGNGAHDLEWSDVIANIGPKPQHVCWKNVSFSLSVC